MGTHAQREALLAHFAATFLHRESNRQSLITVTHATIAPDGKRATVFFTVLPETQEETALSFARRKRNDFRDYLKTHSRFGRIPQVTFAIDLGEKHRQRIEELSQE